MPYFDKTTNNSSLVTEENYITYHRGADSSRVVISAPHGGQLKPTEVPDRRENQCYPNEKVNPTETVTQSEQRGAIKIIGDFLTDQLARDIREAFPDDNKPHVIICELHRSKLDANRDLNEASFGNSTASQAWNQYHNHIEVALHRATANSTRTALFIDVHGNGLPESWNQVGMLITNKQLMADSILPNDYATQSSLTWLHKRTGVQLEDLVRGPTSIGGLLEAKGYPVVPSPHNPHSGNATFFSGGFSTKRYSHGMVSGFQIEVHKRWRFPDESLRRKFAVDLAEVLQRWVAMYCTD